MDINIYLFFKKVLLIYFRQRGGEGERKGEKHQCVVASHELPTGGTWPTTQERALTGNWNPLVHRLVLNPLSHTGQGWI